MEKYQIYRDRMKIEDFGVDEKNSINCDIYNALFNTKFILSRPRNVVDFLDLFNDAYYICTRILIDKRPYFQIEEYKQISKTRIFDPNRYVIILSMVLVYLKSLDLITDDIEKTINIIKNDVTNYNVAEYNKVICVAQKGKTIKATIFLPLDYPDGDYSNYWELYHSFPKAMEKVVDGVISKDKYEGKSGEKDVKTSYLLSGWSNDLKLEEKNKEIKRLQKEIDEWKRKYEEVCENGQEKPFNVQTGGECFTKAKMCLLIYTIASITDGPTPIKKNLAPIISEISGYKQTSVESEIAKAGFKEKDKEEVSKIFEEAMPNFAKAIKEQTRRPPKGKK